MTMQNRRRSNVVSIAVLLLGLSGLGTAFAQPAPAPGIPTPNGPAPLMVPEDISQPTVADVSTTALDPASTVSYGAAMRLRWIMVPKWFLKLFTQANQPLSSVGVGAEFFRRKGDLDIVFGFGWQGMSPGDGNWLGKGKDPGIDTDFIQFRNLGLVGGDISFIWHQKFNEYFGMHYGAGFGLAVVTGQMLRISAAGCTKDNIDSKECRPQPCKNVGSDCTEEILRKTEGMVDSGPAEAHRFRESGVPGALPIINLVLGFDLHIPELKGLEAKLQGGFYNAFFLGFGLGYTF